MGFPKRSSSVRALEQRAANASAPASAGPSPLFCSTTEGAATSSAHAQSMCLRLVFKPSGQLIPILADTTVLSEPDSA